MKFTSNSKELTKFLNSERDKGKTVGFVPTMGALHSGHLSLIQRAHSECDIVVCSIFVNPTQFNEKSDLDKYPRTIEADKKLIEANCHYLFSPESTEEVYGEKMELIEFNFDGLEKELEGEFRPGHFQGMANVVNLLLKLVNPTKAYFGLKDYQQYKIVCRLIEIIELSTEIVGCEIIREVNGLARSSRNELLSKAGRESASVISYALNYIKNYHTHFTISEIKQTAKAMIQGILEIEYLEIRDADTLKEIENWDNKNGVFVSFAGTIDGIRLIDNIRF
jgi:pantoate--beta-alanine ligase